MTTNRRIGLGFTISVSPTGTAGTYTGIGSLINSPQGPGAKADTVDVSLLSDTYKQKAKGQVDSGDVTFSIMYDPDDTSTTTLTALLTQTTTIPAWKVGYPAGTNGAGTVTTETFSGPLVGFSRKASKTGKIEAEITIAVSGGAGYTGE